MMSSRLVVYHYVVNCQINRRNSLAEVMIFALLKLLISFDGLSLDPYKIPKSKKTPCSAFLSVSEGRFL